MTTTIRSERLLLLTLAAIQFTHILDFMIIMPLGPQLMRFFGIGSQQFSLLVSAYTIAAGILGFGAAFIVDRFDRKKVLTVAYTGFIAGTSACAIAPTYGLLLVSRVLAGAFGGMLVSLVFSIIGDIIPEKRRGRATGMVMAGFSIASVLGVPAGLWMAAQFGWHASFLGLAAISLLVLAGITRWVPALNGHLNTSAAPMSPLETITTVLANANQRRALVLTTVMMLGHFTIIPFISPYMVANVGFTEAQLAYIYFFGGCVTFFTAPAVGRLADRFGKPQIFSLFILLSLAPIFIITHLGRTALPVVLLITTIFFIVSNGRFVPAMALITSTVPPQTRGSFMSFNSCVQQLSAGLASFIAGIIISSSPTGQLQHFDYVGYLAIGTSILCLWLVRRIRTVSSTPVN